MSTLTIITLFLVAFNGAACRELDNCKFMSGEPVTTVPIISLPHCKERCWDDDLCTHFNWEESACHESECQGWGTCYIFTNAVSLSGKKAIEADNASSYKCEMRPLVWKSGKKGKGRFGMRCSYLELQPFLSYPDIPFSECFDDCTESQHCTHFTFEAHNSIAEGEAKGTCHMASAPTAGVDEHVVQFPRNQGQFPFCGYIPQRLLHDDYMSFSAIVLKHWPVMVGCGSALAAGEYATLHNLSY